MIFDKKFLYALEATLDIAINSKGNPIESHEITKRQGIPKIYLENILQKLVQENILKGTRGPKGVYSLAKEKRNVSLVEIYNVILAIDKKKPPVIQTEIKKKIITPIISNVSEDIVNYLKSITLDDLYRKIKNIGIKSNTKKKIDFSI